MPADSNIKINISIKGERRYPCGFPGCRWVFTRSNHVLRHHQRVHPYDQKSPDSPKDTTSGTPSDVGSINNGRLFKCDFPACDQTFKTLTLLTRHKRYVHLMIAIQEQMSYIAGGNGSLPQQNTPKTTSALRETKSKGSSHGNGTRLVDHHLPLRVQQQNLVAARLPYVSQPPTPPESSSRSFRDDPYEMPLLPVEVVLRVDENKEWTPENGPIEVSSPSARAPAAEKDEEANAQMSDEEDELGAAPLSASFHSNQHTFENWLTSAQLQVHSVSGSEVNDHSVPGLKQKRPYVCDVMGCYKSYTKHSHLVRHKVETHKMQKPEPKQRGAGTNFIPPPPINLADRPYVCDYPGCRWSFKRQYHLDRHCLTHRIPSTRESDGGSSDNVFQLYDGQSDTDEHDEPLISPNIVTSSKNEALHSTESRGTSLLNWSPVKSENNNTASSSSKFIWPQLVKDKLVNCPACDFRFKNEAMAEQHYQMAHAGGHSSTASLCLLDLKCPSTSSSAKDNNATKSLNPRLSNRLEMQVTPLNSLGKPKACTTPDVSLLNKSHDSSANRVNQLLLEATSNDDVKHSALQFSQLKLLQALTKGNAAAASEAASAMLAAAVAANQQQLSDNNNSGGSFSGIGQALEHDDPDDDEEFIIGNSDSFTEDEKDLLLRDWIGKQKQQQQQSHSQNQPKRPKEKGQVFTCDIQGCDKKFGRNCELTRHKLNHMDVWPFSCDWPGCGRKFKRKDVFKNHQRTHRKEDGGSAVGTPGHEQEEEVMTQAALRAQLEARCNQVLVEDEVDEFDDEQEDVQSYI